MAFPQAVRGNCLTVAQSITPPMISCMRVRRIDIEENKIEKTFKSNFQLLMLKIIFLSARFYTN